MVAVLGGGAGERHERGTTCGATGVGPSPGNSPQPAGQGASRYHPWPSTGAHPPRRPHSPLVPFEMEWNDSSSTLLPHGSPMSIRAWFGCACVCVCCIRVWVCMYVCGREGGKARASKDQRTQLRATPAGPRFAIGAPHLAGRDEGLIVLVDELLVDLNGKGGSRAYHLSCHRSYPTPPCPTTSSPPSL